MILIPIDFVRYFLYKTHTSFIIIKVRLAYLPYLASFITSIIFVFILTLIIVPIINIYLFIEFYYH